MLVAGTEHKGLGGFGTLILSGWLFEQFVVISCRDGPSQQLNADLFQEIVDANPHSLSRIILNDALRAACYMLYLMKWLLVKMSRDQRGHFTFAERRMSDVIATPNNAPHQRQLGKPLAFLISWVTCSTDDRAAE